MENSRLFAPVAEPQSVGALYALVSGERLDQHGAPARAAWEIERLAALRGWPVGETLGSEASLRERLRVSRETLREAVRIVESRGAMRMRRGRSGGLMLMQPTIERTAASLAAYLRAIGMTDEQFAQSVRGLDLLLAWQLARNAAPLAPRRRGEGIRDWLARASGHQTYVIYASALSRLAPAAAAVQLGPRELGNAFEGGDAGEIFRLLSQLPFVPSQDRTAAAEPEIHAQAGAIAVRMIERAKIGAADDLGNEASLCDDFDASRSLVRQALRILQDLDMLRVRLGRGGGYTLKRPSPIGIIRQLFAWLAARNCCPFALNELAWDLNAANLRLAGERLAGMPADERDRLCDRFDRIVAELDGQERFIRLQQAMAEIANCPMVDTLTRSVISYQARSYGDFPDNDLRLVFDRLEGEIAAALRAGAIDRAEGTLRALQDLAYQLRLESFGIAVAAE